MQCHSYQHACKMQMKNLINLQVQYIPTTQTVCPYKEALTGLKVIRKYCSLRKLYSYHY
jgi:hypothetical protein